MKIAFVTPWYGLNIPGGMESETRRTATNLQAAGYNVEILTTCVRDFYAPWDKNFHRPGLTKEGGIPVRRFPVQSVDRSAFKWASWRLQQGQQLSRVEENYFIEEMIRCPGLYEYIANCALDTLFFFIPYLFSTTVVGAQIWPARSAIIPCLHDENYAYLDVYKKVLLQVKSLVLHSFAELALAERLFGPDVVQIRRVIGEGVDVEFEADGGRFCDKYSIRDPFLLVVGRRGPGKNTPLLLHYWRRFKKEFGLPVKMVLIGPGEPNIDGDLGEHVIDLGYVPLRDKYDAYAAATLLCQPSIHESFSLVIMESWLTETPVLVHGDCAVTTEHCRLSNGGLYFRNYPEFAETTNYFFTKETERQKMGQNGRAYVLANFQWPAIIEKYEDLIGDMSNG